MKNWLKYIDEDCFEFHEFLRELTGCQYDAGANKPLDTPKTKTFKGNKLQLIERTFFESGNDCVVNIIIKDLKTRKHYSFRHHRQDGESCFIDTFSQVKQVEKTVVIWETV